MKSAEGVSADPVTAAVSMFTKGPGLNMTETVSPCFDHNLRCLLLGLSHDSNNTGHASEAVKHLADSYEGHMNANKLLLSCTQS